MPIDQLAFIQKGGIVAILLVGIWWLNKNNEKISIQKDKATNDKISYIMKSQEEERTRHVEEEKELKYKLIKRDEIIEKMNNERSVERKEWLGGLNDITNAVKDLSNNVYTKLDKFDKKLDSFDEDLEEIKNKIN